jgi:translation initiation factor 2 beta subunit (eIF-2beta)/eIF-5
MSSDKSQKTMININGSSDPWYRYTMSKIVLILRKNKYVFTNINDVCKQINRPPELLIKFIKKQLAASVTYTNNEAYITKSDLTAEILQKIIFEFINWCVLCKQCGNPETTLDEKLIMQCCACSYVGKAMLNKN